MDDSTQRPWEKLRQLMGQEDPTGLVAYLHTLAPEETERAVFRLAPEEQMRLLTVLPPETAAELIDEVPESHVRCDY